MSFELLPERVEGPRLLLRRWTALDAGRLAAAVERNLGHLRPWMPWVQSEPLTASERLALLDRWEAQWRQGGDVVMAMLIGGEVVGGTGLHRRRGPHRLEIGYWVDADHIGKGLATEAAAVLTTAALGCPGVTSVEIHHDKANIRSRRIPEHLGYGFTGERPDSIDAPGEIGIDCAWQMRAETWSAAGHEGPGASGGVGAS